MSKAAASRTIKFISRGGTYTATVQAPDGDVFQMCDGQTPAVSTVVAPDFTTKRPRLSLVIVSSRQADGVVTPSRVDIFVNNVQLTFDSNNVSTTSFSGESGHFKLIPPSSQNLYFQLQVIKNLNGLLFGYGNIDVKFSAKIKIGSFPEDTLDCMYSIQLIKAQASSKRVVIVAGDNNNFTITEQSSSCILKCEVYEGTNLLNPNDFDYVWSKPVPNNWLKIGSEQFLTVTEAQIDSTGQFRVEAIRKSDRVSFGFDIQTCVDATDPYIIDPRPNPLDETIDENNMNGKVVYTPVLKKRGSGTIDETARFTFIVRDANGIYLNPNSQHTSPSSSCMVTRDMCVRGQGDISIDIFAV